jgi:hypothetical protein
MKMNALFLAVCTALVLSAHTVAFSPCSSSQKADASTRLSYRNYDDITMDISTTEAVSTPPRKQPNKILKQVGGSKSSMPPKLYDEVTFTTLDVDADRMPLSILLDPPAAPLTKEGSEQEQQPQQETILNTSLTQSPLRVTSTASRAATRSSPITQLLSIQDYNKHVLNSSPNQLCIIRFHAPWCQVCRTTNVSWERMASKLVKMNSSTRAVKFLSVSLDGKNEEVVELKDMLNIEGVPMGVIHHESDGVIEQKVNLNRKNLGVLKKQLESYLTNEMGADLFLYELKKET